MPKLLRYLDSDSNHEEKAEELQTADDLLIGASLESVDVDVTSNGSTISLNIEKNGGGDVRFIFTDGVHTHDCTPADSVNLTAGTDTAPQINYIYILQSTKALTASITGWPSAEHAPIATVLCQSAASAQTDGLYKVHAWTDHTKNDETGHLAHLNYWIRQQHATWVSGGGVTPSVGVGTFDVATASGEALQLHPHTFPAFDTGATDEIMVVNDNTTPYDRVGDLTGKLTDSEGVSMSGNYYNLVIWVVVSEDTGDCQLMCNLPNASYNTESDAIDDVNRSAIYEMPTTFKGTGILLARLTVQHSVSGGGTWSISQNEDLRGLVPSTGAGGGGAGGGGDVFKVGTPVDNQIGVWTGNGTIEGNAAFTFDSATDTMVIGDGTGNVVSTLNRGSGAGFGEITMEEVGVDTWGVGFDNTQWYLYNYIFGGGSYAITVAESDNSVTIGGVTDFSGNQIENISSAYILDAANAGADQVNQHQYWVKSGVGGDPKPYFTDEDGNDNLILTSDATNLVQNNVGTTLMAFSVGGSANYPALRCDAAGSPVGLYAQGSDANIDVDIFPKGTGNVQLGTITIDADQALGAGVDGYVFTYDHGTGLVSLEAAAGGGSGDALKETITQAGHGFAAGDVIRRSSGSYIKAQADTSANADMIIGMVESVSGDDFTVVKEGLITITSNFADNTRYWLSPDTAGETVTVDNPDPGEISLPIAIGRSANTAEIVRMRGIEVGEGSYAPGDLTASMRTSKTGWLICDGTASSSYALNDYKALAEAVRGGDTTAGEAPLTAVSNVGTTTYDSTTDKATLVGHGLSDGDMVWMHESQLASPSWGARAPGNLVAMYVRNSTTNDYQVSETIDGTISQLNTDAGGTATYSRFHPPDLRGRAAVGSDNMGNGAASRISTTYFGSTNTPDIPGQAGGAESHTLAIGEIPSHSHTLNQATTGGSGSQNRTTGAGTGAATSTAGGGGAHKNVQPSLTVNWFIKA